MSIKNLFVAAMVFFIASPAYAVEGITLEKPEDINAKILCPIFTWMFWILMSLSVIMVLIGGYMYLTKLMSF